jgi:hypothetical protein
MRSTSIHHSSYTAVLLALSMVTAEAKLSDLLSETRSPKEAEGENALSLTSPQFKNLNEPKLLGSNCCSTSQHAALRRWLSIDSIVPVESCAAVCRNEPTCVAFDVGTSQRCNMYSIGTPTVAVKMEIGSQLRRPEDIILGHSPGGRHPQDSLLPTATGRSGGWCSREGFQCYLVKRSSAKVGTDELTGNSILGVGFACSFGGIIGSAALLYRCKYVQQKHAM